RQPRQRFGIRQPQVAREEAGEVKGVIVAVLAFAESAGEPGKVLCNSGLYAARSRSRPRGKAPRHWPGPRSDRGGVHRNKPRRTAGQSQDNRHGLPALQPSGPVPSPRPVLWGVVPARDAKPVAIPAWLNPRLLRESLRWNGHAVRGVVARQPLE